jgi:hypothetical protein
MGAASLHRLRINAGRISSFAQLAASWS